MYFLVDPARSDEGRIQKVEVVGGHDHNSPGCVDDPVQHVQESLCFEKRVTECERKLFMYLVLSTVEIFHAEFFEDCHVAYIHLRAYGKESKTKENKHPDTHRRKAPQ